MDPFGIFGAVLGVFGLRDPRTPQITRGKWDIRRGPERDDLGLAITVANDNKRPITVVEAGTMSEPGQFDPGAAEGVPFKLEDGEEATLWIRPLNELLDRPQPVKVWVRTAVGKRAVGDIRDARPRLSNGESAGSDF